MTKQILHVVGDSQYGGGSVVILQLAQAARDAGYDVSILSTAPQFKKAIQNIGVNVVDLDCIWRDIRPLRDIIGLWRLYKYLKSTSYDIVHTHTSKAGFVGRAAATLARIPVIIHTVHGFAFHEQSKPLAMMLYSLLERMASRWCHKMVTVSEYHREWGLRLGIGKPYTVIAIPNGISEDRVRCLSKNIDFLRTKFGIDEKDTVLVSAGRLAQQKGIEFLIQAVKKLIEKGYINLKVVLAGDGPLRNELEVLVAAYKLDKNFHFLGFRSDVADILAIGDLAVMPTEREGLSISLLEAMAAGKPIITTTIGSNLEVTENGKYAKLVPPKDVDALAAAIEEIIQNPVAAKRMGESARLKFLDTYTENQMISKYILLYEQFIHSVN